MKNQFFIFLFFCTGAGAALFPQDAPLPHVAEIKQPSGEGGIPHWYIGVEGAYDYNTMYSFTGYRPFKEYRGGHGFAVGIPVRFAVFKWLAVQSGVQFIQKNYSLVNTNDENRYDNWTNSFLEFPILAQGSVGLGSDKARLFASAGVELGVWLIQNEKGSQFVIADQPNGDRYILSASYRKYDVNPEWDGRKDNRFDAALLGGIGVQYNFKTCSVFIEGRYYYGLTDLEKKYQRDQVPHINDTFVISAGVLFNSNVLNVFRRTR